jgi:pantetheine-phosphate adenylyltransferase
VTVTLALYPGSFDPITYGHLNIIERAQKAFDRVVVAVAINRKKTPLFPTEERIAMIREALGPKSDVEVESFEGLLVDYATQRGAQVVLRGLRAISDFEYEFQMAHMNKRLSPELETVFMMTGEAHFFVSSQLVREIASFHGQLSGLVPPHVEARLRQKFAQ